MLIKTEKTGIQDLIIVKPEVFEDDRGFFSEVYRKDQFKQLGLPDDFVQLNHSKSPRNVLRGLHFQWEPPMGKLMRVTFGSAYLVAVDIRKGSPTFGWWEGYEVSAENKINIWAPAGFARGFCVLSENAEIQYLTTGIYNSACESGIAWNDPEIGINWPIDEPILSEKDQKAQSLSDWLKSSESNYFYHQENK
tara:strand:+ start:660 stop:1238 length:579 start_codon:yes stop_codon:yes gene_type:complete